MAASLGCSAMTMLNLLSCRCESCHTLGSGRPPASLDGTFTQASPSSTTSPATEQVQLSRARNFSGISSTTTTLHSTVSLIFTGVRKFSVCETRRFLEPLPAKHHLCYWPRSVKLDQLFIAKTNLEMAFGCAQAIESLPLAERS